MFDFVIRKAGGKEENKKNRNESAAFDSKSENRGNSKRRTLGTKQCLTCGMIDRIQ